MGDLHLTAEPARPRPTGPRPAVAPRARPAPASFEALYEASYRPLVRLAYLLTQVPEVADDLVQDVFARALPRWRRLDDPLPYLRRSVVNAANSWHRRRRLERDHRGGAEGATSMEVDELFDVLAELPPRQRAALVLRFYEDLPDAEVASVLGCRPGTVASLVHRGLARLRVAMGEPERRDEGATS